MLTRSASQSSPQTIAKRSLTSQSLTSRTPPPQLRTSHSAESIPTRTKAPLEVAQGSPAKLKPLDSPIPPQLLGQGGSSFQKFWEGKRGKEEVSPFKENHQIRHIDQHQLLGSLQDWCSPINDGIRRVRLAEFFFVTCALSSLNLFLSNFILFLQKPRGKSGENLKLEPLRREPFSVEDLQRNLPPPPSLNSPEFQSVAQRLHNTKMLKHQSRFNVNPRSPDINYHYKMPSSASKDSVSVGGHLYKI